LTPDKQAPHAIEYFVLRACERLGMNEREFRELPYAEQVRVLAYEGLREGEE
jgi:hypothetical protein